ncbi:MAG: DUF4843 domain-containing protein [Rikenellaceae bacterium]|nr:DUF4843 domain-containing protein [Rikenellaceae bacterium]MCL2693382.1 DUF4843 domain-containing protein [Rikenellaceae bacterium]
MKTNIKGFIIVLSVLALIFGCENEKVPLYDSAIDGVYFGTTNAASPIVVINNDTSRFAFGALPNPNVESHIFTIPVSLMGTIADHDREFRIEIYKEPTNPGTRYEIIQPSVLKAGATSAVAEIRVWKTSNLMSQRDVITLRLVGTKDLTAIKAGFMTHCFTIYGGFDRPEWWTDSVIDNTMGRFHEIKMEIMLIVLGSTNNPLTPSNQQPVNLRALNDYCEENNIKYPGTDELVRFVGERFINI